MYYSNTTCIESEQAGIEVAQEILYMYDLKYLINGFVHKFLYKFKF